MSTACTLTGESEPRLLKSSDALLALWNASSVDAEEYNAWHTREHVLERLTVDGIFSVRRYVKTQGPLPDYLTLYWLESTDVLTSREYLDLLQRPSHWSQSMRLGLTDVIRHGCSEIQYFGRGIGGEAAIKLVRFDASIAPALAEYAESASGRAITATTLAQFAPDIPSLPFATGLRTPNDEGDALLMIEGFDPMMLQEALPELDRQLELNGADGWTSYRLAFVAGEDDATPASIKRERKNYARTT